MSEQEHDVWKTPAKPITTKEEAQRLGRKMAEKAIAKLPPLKFEPAPEPQMVRCPKIGSCYMFEDVASCKVHHEPHIKGKDCNGSLAKDCPACVPVDKEPLYPCADCGKLRTKAQGGTTFTVCEECWDKKYGKSKPAAPSIDNPRLLTLDEKKEIFSGYGWHDTGTLEQIFDAGLKAQDIKTFEAARKVPTVDEIAKLVCNFCTRGRDKDLCWDYTSGNQIFCISARESATTIHNLWEVSHD